MRRHASVLCRAVASLCICLCAAGVAAQVSETERQALVAFYESTRGEGWTDASGWLGPAGTECDWFGIRCTSDHRVERIQMPANNLSGPIPPEIGDLEALEFIDLQFNDLTGPLPAELGALAGLEVLALWDNRLSGEIPSALGALSKLRTLRLRDNQLVGKIPPELASLAQLTTLDLKRNRLDGPIPAQLAQLSRLVKLDLGENELTGPIPPQLGRLADLEWLYLNTNTLSGRIPEELADLSSLEILGLWSAGLSGPIPPELGRLHNLQWLLLYRNDLSGGIPAELGELSSLTRLDLWENRLTGPIPPQIGNLSNLEVAWLDDNLLSGPLPERIGDLSSLRELFLGSNQLAGSVPVEITDLDNLERLILAYNGLSIESQPVQDFMDSRSGFVFLASTQTVPPADVTATAQGTGSVLVTWTPIDYITGDGGYRVLYSSSASGPWTLSGETTDKTVSWWTVDGLEPGTSYFFQVRSVTSPHEWNQGTVVSEPSETVSSSTASAGSAGSIQLAFGSLAAAEGESKEIVVRRLGGVGGTVSVSYSATGETASAGSDFETTSGTLTWSDGDAAPRAIVLPVIDDAATETTETLSVTLSTPTGGAVLGSPASARVTLSDNDFAPDGEAQASSVGTDPVVVSQPSGDRLVLWADRSATAGELDIVAQRYGANGASVGGRLQVASSTKGDQHSPSAAVNDVGTTLAVWVSDAVGGKALQGGNAIVGRLLGADGQPEGGEIVIDDGTRGPVAGPRAAHRAGDSGFVVAWEREAGGGKQAGNAIVGRLVGDDGVPEADEVVLDDGSDGTVGSPDVAWSSRGQGIVAWERADEQGDPDVHARMIDVSGRTVAPSFRVNDDTRGGQERPAVVATKSGSFVVAWQGPSLPDPFGNRTDGSDVFARAYALQGRAAGPPIRLNASELHTQRAPRVETSSTGDCLVAWHHVEQSGRTAVFGRLLPFCDVVAKRLTGDLPLDAGGGLPLRAPDVALSDAGDITTVYSQDDVDEGDGGVAGNAILAGFPSQCSEGGLNLCLNDSRFRVEVVWEDFAGRTGSGLAESLTEDTGTFWFFNDANIELIVKVLDGTGVNGHYWVFFGALTNVAYTLTITDTETGNSVSYDNPLGSFASFADVNALPDGGRVKHRIAEVAGVEERWAAWRSADLVRRPDQPPGRTIEAGDCVADDTTLCLNDSRFSVAVDWRTTDGRAGHGRASPLTPDTGTFWFFDDANIELVVKVLDARAVNGHYWVFFGALSDVEYTVTVEDTATGAVQSYPNTQGQMASVGDTDAFPGP